MLFIISNSKLGIWLCSQPRVDLNLQSNSYNNLARPHKYFSNTLYKTTCTENNLHVSFTKIWVFYFISFNQCLQFLKKVLNTVALLHFCSSDCKTTSIIIVQDIPSGNICFCGFSPKTYGSVGVVSP